MRTSGGGSTDRLLFVLPAAIFLGFFIWTFGEPAQMLATVDRMLRQAWSACVSWIAALL